MATNPKSFDRVADRYDATRALPEHVQAAAIEGFMGALREVAATPTVLEVGIGTGRMAVPLAAAGARVVGVDIAPAMLARLRAKQPDFAVVRADATALPFAERTFDAALFVHILHLLADPAAALRAATRTVRPGGVLLFGRTDYSDSPRRRMIVRVRELARELAGVDLASGAAYAAANRAFADQARDAGARLAEAVLARWGELATGRELLTDLADRVYSSSWAIPEAVMPELLRRLTPWVEDAFGGLDRQIENEATFALITARLPR